MPHHDSKLENLNSRIDMHTHAGSALDNCVTLTFDLLTSGAVHAERLTRTIYVYQLWC